MRSGIRKLADGKGLYLAVTPNGWKLWRMKYRFGGAGNKRVERLYSIGAFPEVSLAQARVERDRARSWLRDGKDPVVEKRVVKASVGAQQAATFGAIAELWFAAKAKAWSTGHRHAQRSRLDR